MSTYMVLQFLINVGLITSNFVTRSWIMRLEADHARSVEVLTYELKDLRRRQDNTTPHERDRETP